MQRSSGSTPKLHHLKYFWIIIYCTIVLAHACELQNTDDPYGPPRPVNSFEFVSLQLIFDPTFLCIWVRQSSAVVGIDWTTFFRCPISLTYPGSVSHAVHSLETCEWPNIKIVVQSMTHYGTIYVKHADSRIIWSRLDAIAQGSLIIVNKLKRRIRLHLHFAVYLCAAPPYR